METSLYGVPNRFFPTLDVTTDFRKGGTTRKGERKVSQSGRPPDFRVGWRRTRERVDRKYP